MYIRASKTQALPGVSRSSQALPPFKAETEGPHKLFLLGTLNTVRSALLVVCAAGTHNNPVRKAYSKRGNSKPKDSKSVQLATESKKKWASKCNVQPIGILSFSQTFECVGPV